jgi:transposase
VVFGLGVRDNDGRKLDHATLEVMRIRAVQAVEAGQRPEDVAASLGMARGTVFMWLAKYREGGLEALKARPVPGKPPKLNGQQMQRLYALVAGADPRQLQFEFALWTRELVRRLERVSRVRRTTGRRGESGSRCAFDSGRCSRSPCQADG